MTPRVRVHWTRLDLRTYSQAFSTRYADCNADAVFQKVIRTESSVASHQAGADLQIIRRGLQKALVRLPSQDPPPDNLTFSSSLIKVFREAQKIQKQNGDTHISQDTLILALYTDMTLNKILKEGNAAQDRVQDAVRVIRAGRTVDNASAEDAFEALRKYATDMTQLAIEGKLVSRFYSLRSLNCRLHFGRRN